MMPRMLASVTSLAEAHLAIAAGAEIIDLKDPHNGALGALPCDTVAEIVREIGTAQLLSATIGDIPDMAADQVLPRVAAMAETGVTIVKIGLFPCPALHETLLALEPLARAHLIVAVLFADRAPDFAVIPTLAACGFKGVMLDTAGKDGRSLRDHLSPATLQQFLTEARRYHLMTGLAGSLRIADIAPLAALQPDYLGFRGALCGGQRTLAFNLEAAQAVRAALHQATETLSA